MKKALSLLLAVLLVAMMIPSLALAEEGEKVLRFGTNSLKGTFNPILSSDVYDGYACDLMFAGLVGTDEGANIVFDEDTIATGYTLSEDHLTYTFTLKEGLAFQNGDPLTANDVAFTYKMMGHPEYDGPRAAQVADMAGYRAYHDGESDEFEGIVVIDEYTISFTLEEPYVAKIYDFGFGILSENYYGQDTYEAFKDLNGAPMGAGPFMFDDFDPGQALHVVRNPNWFGREPKLDGVSILIIPTETQIMALSSGQVDLIQAGSANRDNYDAIVDGGAEAIVFIGLGFNCMMLNHQTPKLSDVNVRRALMHGFDRAGFIDNEYEGFASPCRMLVYDNPEFWAYPRESAHLLNSYEYDPELSKQILADAGWAINDNGIWEKDGVELDLTMYIYDDVAWPQNLASLLKEQWEDIGIGFQTIIADFDTVMDEAYDNRAFEKFDMWTQGWSMSIDPDMSDLLGRVAFESAGGFNPGGYINEEAEELFSRGRQEFDLAKRAEIYAEWAVLSNQDLPMLFNAVRQEIWGIAPGVTGFGQMNPFYGWVSCILDVDIAG